MSETVLSEPWYYWVLKINIWIDINLNEHRNCSVGSSKYCDLVWAFFLFWGLMIFSLIVLLNFECMNSDLRTFNTWICLIWTDLISVLGVLQLLGVVNFVVLISRDFHNEILKWRLMVKIWKILRCIARLFFFSHIQALSENIDSCV